MEQATSNKIRQVVSTIVISAQLIGGAIGLVWFLSAQYSGLLANITEVGVQVAGVRLAQGTQQTAMEDFGKRFGAIERDYAAAPDRRAYFAMEIKTLQDNLRDQITATTTSIKGLTDQASDTAKELRALNERQMIMARDLILLRCRVIPKECKSTDNP